MNKKTISLLPLFLSVVSCADSGLATDNQLLADPAIDCSNCEEWNQPQEPFRIFGNTYYVGVAGLSSILIDSGDGLFLLDGALPQSAPMIAANIETLGFSLADVKIIGHSHAHYDHVGGINALQRASGARVVARAAARDALQKGDLMPDDPQVTSRTSNFPAVQAVELVADGETIQLGNIELTAMATPGHTPGGTTWTWQTCEGERCLDVVYADSLSAVSWPPFRFNNDPRAAAGIRKSARIIANLDCDIFLAPHPFYFEMSAKLAADGATEPFVQSGCGAYAKNALEQLERRLLQEMRM